MDCRTARQLLEFARPRSLELVNSREFGVLFDRAFHLIREEVTKTLAEQAAAEMR